MHLPVASAPFIVADRRQRVGLAMSAAVRNGTMRVLLRRSVR